MLPPGSFLNATLPAPCGGMVECRAVMIAAMVSALGQAVPEKLVGDLKGGANHVYISGPRPIRGGGSSGLFLLYEYPAGGTGATREGDGNHVVRAYPEGDFNVVQAAEIAEMQCPVRIEQYGLREDSSGDGEHRGGCGMRRDIRVLVDGASLSVLADHAVIPPFGVAGGRSGAANRFVVIRDGETIEPSPVPGKVGGFKLKAGDIVRLESSGGGGHGDPVRRDPEAVARYIGSRAAIRWLHQASIRCRRAPPVPDATVTHTWKSAFFSRSFFASLSSRSINSSFRRRVAPSPPRRRPPRSDRR